MKQQTQLRYDSLMQNEHLRLLADQPYWTISDANKMPVSIASLRAHYGPRQLMFKDKDGNERAYYGASFKKPEDMETLHGLMKFFPSAPNFAFYLHDDGEYAVLDIEPSATDDIKKMMLATPWLYAEKSMSGKGYHILIKYPTDMLRIFPDAHKPTLKSDDSTYELHLAHWLTFTGDVVEKDDTWGTVSMTSALTDLFRAQKVSAKVTIQGMEPIEDPEDSIPKYAAICHALCSQMRYYGKRLADFSYDQSRYDMSLLYYMTRQFIFLSNNPDAPFDIRDYTISEIATIIGMSVHHYQAEAGLDRKKYYETRDGLPFLIWRAYTAATNCLTEDGIEVAKTRKREIE